MKRTKVFVVFIAAMLLVFFIGARFGKAQLNYRLVDASQAQFLGAIINGAVPAALPAGVGVHSATVRFDGIDAATDHVIGWEVPAPNASCPLIGIRVTGNNQLTADWVSTAAGACTPTAGSYKVLILRF